MKCPFCKDMKDKVVDSREINDNTVVRRRRECLSCGKRFTTYERIDEIAYYVIKKNNSKVPFEREKLLRGISKACEKRPVTDQEQEALVDSIVMELYNREDREIPSDVIGGIVMERLKNLDQVAYVRFASVYRDFKDLDEFMHELEDLVKRRRRK